MAEEAVRVPSDSLRRFCQAAFEAVGLASPDAALAADTLVEADLRGVPSHGTWWVGTYTRRLRAGGVNPRPDLRFLQEAPAAAVLDADDALGQVAAAAAMRRAIQMAREAGVGAVAVRRSNHFGAAAYYAMLAARENLIGFATTDADPILPPWGGSRPVVGNNPLAFAIPVEGSFPLVLDMAQSVVAWGKIFLAAQRGEAIPPTWAFDARGQPTTDPRRAMVGMLQPVGGYKGYGLALVMEVLGGVLSGARFGLDIPPMEDDSASQAYGHFLLALDIAHFMSPETFQTRIERLVAEHREVPPAAGVRRTYLPGEIEHLKREENLRVGIPLEPHALQTLKDVGAELELDIGFLP